MKLRRHFEAWITIDDGDGEPLVKCYGRYFTRGGAQRRVDSIVGDEGLNLGLLMAYVYHSINIHVHGEVRET